MSSTIEVTVVSGDTEQTLRLNRSPEPNQFVVDGMDPQADALFAQDLPALLARFIDLGPSAFDPASEVTIRNSVELEEMVADRRLTLYRINSSDPTGLDISFFGDEEGRWLIGDQQTQLTLQPVSSLKIWLLLCEIAATLDEE